MKEGKVSYSRRPEDEFLQFVWFALRSGVWISSAIDAWVRVIPIAQGWRAA